MLRTQWRINDRRNLLKDTTRKLDDRSLPAGTVFDDISC